MAAIVGTLLLRVGSMTVSAGILVGAFHAANKSPRYARVTRMDAEGPPRPKINALHLAAALNCIGAALLLVGAYLATTPN
jgi:hypothetical protein